MALDLYAVQQSIKAHIQSEFTTYRVHEGGLPDDATLPRVNGKLVNYILLMWGSIQLRPGGGAVGGSRWEDYFSTVDIFMVGERENDARSGLSLVVDRLIGWRPEGGGAMDPRGGSGSLVTRNSQGNVTAYLPNQRFTFSVNTDDVAGYIPVP